MGEQIYIKVEINFHKKLFKLPENGELIIMFSLKLKLVGTNLLECNLDRLIKLIDQKVLIVTFWNSKKLY